MKKLFLLALTLILMLACAAAAEERPRIILITVYQQMGWGDRIEVGCVDEKGGMWTLSGSASALEWPAGLEKQLDYLQGSQLLTQAGTLDSEALFDLKGLIACTEAQEVKTEPAANDAGTETSRAIVYQNDIPEAICLGISGDDVYENTDPNAQALYALLRRLFPSVTCYGDGMGPAGFQPIPVLTFLGLDAETIRGATIREYAMDCEAGPIEVEPADESARDLVLNGIVVGKANATVLTGGTVAFDFLDDGESYLGGFEMYHGMIATNDGMYYVAYPEA